MNEQILPQSGRRPRRRVLLAGLSMLASFVCNLSFAQAPQWRQFRRDDLGFVIEFPAEPTVTDEPQTDQDSELIRRFQATCKLGNTEYSVGCEESRTAVDAEDIWDHVAGVFKYHVPGIRLANVINLPGRYPTRHCIGEPDPASRGQTGFMSSRNVVVDKKWIDCVVVSDRAIETDPLARRFFDSFSLL